MSGWKVGDTEPPLTGTVLDGAAGVDLTAAASVAVHIRKPTTKTVLTKTPALANQGTDPGKWSVAWVAGDLDEAGPYELEVEVTWSAGRVQTFPSDGYSRFTVTAEIA